MKQVVVLGSSGMLGHMLSNILSRDKEIALESFDRSTLDVYPKNITQLGSRLSKLCGYNTDYVVNCIGAIKPVFKDCTNPSVQLYTNSVFPHQLATWCELTQTKLIHISTDCVFRGTRVLNTPYLEYDLADAVDIYGKSKSLGEPKNAMVIRTSIIGPEFGGRKRSLLEWVKGQENGEINGFTNHFWNGLTTLEFSKCLVNLIKNDLWRPYIHHLFSTQLSKYDMIKEIITQYNLNIQLHTHDGQMVNRTLGTHYSLQEKLQPLSYPQMIEELVKWENAK